MRQAIGLAVAVAALAVAGCASHTREPPPAPADTLYLAGIKPGTLTVVQLRANRVEKRRLKELSPGDPLYFITATGGRLIAYGHDRTYSFGPAAREPGRSLGESSFFVPSATPGRVWLALFANPRMITLRALREVTARGATTVASTPKPPAWPIAALTTGFVIQRKTLELWKPGSGTITRLPGLFPIAARGSMLASCDDPCPLLHISDTRARTELDLRAPAGTSFVPTYAQDTFSPNGKLLAVPVKRSNRRYAVAVIDLARRAVRVLPGPRLASDYPLITWARSGWLYFKSRPGRIAAYRPGEAAARLIPVRVGQFIDLAA